MRRVLCAEYGRQLYLHGVRWAQARGGKGWHIPDGYMKAQMESPAVCGSGESLL
jgi:hypothetical protein